MSLRACIDCGIPAKATRCPRCHHTYQQRRGPSGWDRQRANAAFLAANPWCAVCKMVKAITVDHIRPLWMGGSAERHNWQGLCGPCHRAKTAREARIRQGGRR